MKYQDLETSTAPIMDFKWYANTKVVDKVYVVLYNNPYVTSIQGVFASYQAAEQMLKKHEIVLRNFYLQQAVEKGTAMTEQQAKEEAKLSISRYYGICTYEVQE